MSLVLYGHPFSSYTQKVLIALYENGTPFEFRCIGPDTPQHSAEWLKRWPLRKFPLLVDGERNIVETSIIIEYLQLAHRFSTTQERPPMTGRRFGVRLRIASIQGAQSWGAS
jgi:glutathione S-transferase